MVLDWQPLGEQAPVCLLGESPFWHPEEAALYWCDIPGKSIHRWRPGAARGAHRRWDFDTEPGCMAPMLGGGLLVAFRDGLFAVALADGSRRRLCAPPYDPARERFNDGKADAQGRFWVGTIYEPRDRAAAALYRWDRAAGLCRVAGDITVSNGLAFAPDGRSLCWADTFAHRVFRFDVDTTTGNVAGQQVWAEFPRKPADGKLEGYGGRPDGAAMDTMGNCWVAMFEGQRLLCLSGSGAVLHDLPLPVRCATMPCFGGPDLRTLFVTTARENRPAEELARQPLAGQVLMARVPVPGLPVNFAR